MSLPWGGSAGIALMAPVTTVAGAAAAAAAGAQLADAGRDGVLVPAIRRAVGGVLVCGEHETADLVRDPGRAARTGAVLICPGTDEAAAAVRRGIAAGRILVQAAPAGIEAAVRAGWTVLADLDELDDLEELAARAEAAGAEAARAEAARAEAARAEAGAAVCVWLGARVLRTRYVAEVRRSADMTESILGRRPPAWAVRGLA
jgi:hypothetical protein